MAVLDRLVSVFVVVFATEFDDVFLLFHVFCDFDTSTREKNVTYCNTLTTAPISEDEQNADRRVQKQKDEFKARLRAEGRDRQSQKIAKDKRDSCLCLSCFIVLVLIVNLLIWQYILTRQI